MSWVGDRVNCGPLGIRGNHHADALAKAAATIAFNCKYNFDNIIKYNTFNNPINVDISKDIIYLNKLYKRERKEEWLHKDKTIGIEIK